MEIWTYYERNFLLSRYKINLDKLIAQSAGAVEYTDFFSAKE